MGRFLACFTWTGRQRHASSVMRRGWRIGIGPRRRGRARWRRRVIDRVVRHQTLEWGSRWCDGHGKTLRIWGDGWATHPTLGKHAAGVALPGAQAEAVFRSSVVNLQIIETGVLHSRLLDGWAA